MSVPPRGSHRTSRAHFRKGRRAQRKRRHLHRLFELEGRTYSHHVLINAHMLVGVARWLALVATGEGESQLRG